MIVVHPITRDGPLVTRLDSGGPKSPMANEIIVEGRLLEGRRAPIVRARR